jgi:flavorubredoxin
MTVTNAHSGTQIDEIDRGIWRISTPIAPDPTPTGFTMNQFLVVDDEPLLFHTGPRSMLPLVREAIEHVLPLERLRWISYSHAEADESGALDELLALAPEARAVCGAIGAMIAFDGNPRAPRVLADGEAMSTGRRQLVWLDTPHVPHGWDAGLLFDTSTRTLLCSDLFTRAGTDHPPVTGDDVFAASEPLRKQMGYMPCSIAARRILDRLAAREPAVLACMHGSSFRGDAAALLRELGGALERDASA